MRQSKLSKQTEGAITLIIIISLLTSISTARGLGEDFMNLEWNLMEKAGDIEPLGSAGAARPATSVKAAKVLWGDCEQISIHPHIRDCPVYAIVS